MIVGLSLEERENNPRLYVALVRCARFSETKNLQSFYQSILQLFLPSRSDVQLKPQPFETFEQFYMNAHVRFSDESTNLVKLVVDVNRGKFEIQGDELDNIQNSIDANGIAEDAWAELCLESEVERLECEQERRETEQVAEGQEESIADLAVSRAQVAHLEKRNNVMCRDDGLALVKSLNETQLYVFYQVRQWCLEKMSGKNPDPLHVFVTGGAGTRKSHLIKAVQYEATRLLSTVCRHPDNVCFVDSSYGH